MALFGFGKRKVLLAEDDEGVRALIRDTLAMNGYDVEEASDGEEALGKLKGSKYSLLVLDIHMPRRSGLEVLEVLRASPDYKKLPVLIVTTDGMLEPMKRASELGVSGYVIKPFTAKALLDKVSACLPSK